MLSENCRKIVNGVLAMDVDNATKRDLLEKGLAAVIAYSVPVPADLTTSPAMYYSEYSIGPANDVLSCINELFVVDINRIRDCAKDIWLARYNVSVMPLSDQSLELVERVTSPQEVVVPAEGEQQPEGIPTISMESRRHFVRTAFTALSPYLKKA